MCKSMKTQIVATLAVVALLGVGCAPIGEGHMVMYASVGGAYKPVHTTSYDLENHPVVLMDKNLDYHIAIASIEQTTAPDGRLHVNAKFRDRANHRIETQVSCVFNDEHGFPIGDETPWQTLIVTENAQEGVSFVAMNAQGKRATIRIRQAR